MKTTLEEWREFPVMFENLMFEGDITEEEGYEKLEEEIIHGMVLWVAEKEWKEVKKTPPLRSLSPSN